MAIHCCHNCHRPQKGPYCHIAGNCPIHDLEKKLHEERREQIMAEKAMEDGITESIIRQVEKTTRRRRT